MDLESTYTIVVVRNIKVFSTLPRNYKMVYPPISILEQQGEQWQYFHTSVLMYDIKVDLCSSSDLILTYLDKQLNQVGAEQQGKPHNLTHMHFGGQNPNM